MTPNDRDVDATTSITYALRNTVRITVCIRKLLTWHRPSLHHAQFNGSGLCRRMMGATPHGGCYSRAIMDEARSTDLPPFVTPRPTKLTPVLHGVGFDGCE